MGLHPPVPASALHETDMELQDVYTFDTYVLTTEQYTKHVILRSLMCCCRVCLPAGCYEAEMTWNRSIVRNPYPPDENFPPDMNPHIPSYSEAMGMLAFIPQCNAFFSPLLQKQEICLDEVSFAMSAVQLCRLMSCVAHREWCIAPLRMEVVWPPMSSNVIPPVSEKIMCSWILHSARHLVRGGWGPISLCIGPLRWTTSQA